MEGNLFDYLLGDRRKAKMLIVLSVLILILGLALSYMPVYKADQIAKECNAHWQEQIKESSCLEQAKIPSFTPDKGG